MNWNWKRIWGQVKEQRMSATLTTSPDRITLSRSGHHVLSLKNTPENEHHVRALALGRGYRITRERSLTLGSD